MIETCSQYQSTTYSFRPLRCHRPVKDEGLCAQHLAGKRRSEKAAQRYKDQANLSEQALEEVQDALNKLGITGSVYYSSFEKRYVRSAIVSIRTLIELSEREPKK